MATALRRRPRRSGSTRRPPRSSQLPRLWIPVSGFMVTPVLAWWHAPHPVRRSTPPRWRASSGCRSRSWSIRRTGCGSAIPVAGSARRSRYAACSSGASPPGPQPLLELGGWARPGTRTATCRRRVATRRRHRIRGRTLAPAPVPLGRVPGSVVDLVLIALMIMFASTATARASSIGALSFVGFFGGALVGLQLGPWWPTPSPTPPGCSSRWSPSSGSPCSVRRSPPGLGTRLRIADTHGGRRVDDVGAVFVSVLALLLVAWMVAGPLASSSMPWLSRSVRNSAILHGVDTVMPDQARALYNGLRGHHRQRGLPRTSSATSRRPGPARWSRPTRPWPARRWSPGAAVRGEDAGTAPSCRRRIEGSGFVYAPQHVMTNAHVVAGTRGGHGRARRRPARAGSSSTTRSATWPCSTSPGSTRPPWSGPRRWRRDRRRRDRGRLSAGRTVHPGLGPGPGHQQASRVPTSTRAQTVVREVYTIRGLEVRSGNSGGRCSPRTADGARGDLRGRPGRPGHRLRR